MEFEVEEPMSLLRFKAYCAGLSGDDAELPSDPHQRIIFRLAYASGDVDRRVLRAMRLLMEAQS